MAEQVNVFQRAVLRSALDGRYSDLAKIDDYLRLASAMRKAACPAVLTAVVAELRGADDVQTASCRMVDADAVVKDALAAVGAIAMARAR